MLSSLHISNYVLIDSLDAEFPGGLNIITGQTGAGKSILLGALSLLTGVKADAGMVSEGAENCVVEGEFTLADDSIRALLEESEVEWEEGTLLIRRVVNRSGRSRAFVNDSPVPLTLLQQLSEHLVDIHSQHRSLLLSDKRFQLSVLDHFAGNDSLLERCGGIWKKMLSLRKELADARARLQELERDKDYNEAQFRELDAAKLNPGELEELEAEQKQLANAESIKEALAQVRILFEPGEGASIDSSLKEASRLLDRASAYVPSLAALAERIRSSRIELDDIAASVADADSRVNVSQSRLQEVDERISLLYSLLRKHGCRTLQELAAVRDRFSDALYDSGALEEKVSSLEKDLAAAGAEHASVCAALHEGRIAAAVPFAAEIQSSLRFLELDGAVFEVQVAPSEAGERGADVVSFLFSSSGKNPVDVAKCASGGEISRIMLCLKAEMARYQGMPTMIFDEIDTGVSGSAADAMGTMICRMGADMQVLAITHLPQVAAKGDAHFVVEKSGSTTIRRVWGEDRVQEIARLLSGASITPEALANARTLLGGKA